MRSNRRVERILDVMPYVFGGALVLLGGVVFVFGWWLHHEVVHSPIEDIASMKANTAIAVTMLGLAIISLGPKPRASQNRRIFGRIMAVGTLVVAGISGVEFVLGTDWGFDEYLFTDAATPSGDYPGRMSISAVIGFLFAGAALFLRGSVRPGRIRASEPLIGALAAISVLALAGYVYNVQALYGLGIYRSMSPHTAVALTLAAIGLGAISWRSGSFANLANDTADGMLLRRMLPAAFFVPFFLGAAVAFLDSVGNYPKEILVLALAISSGGVLILFVLSTGRTLRRLDLAQRQAQRALDAQREWAQTTLASIGEGVIATDYEGKITAVNKSARNILQLRGDPIGLHIDAIALLKDEKSGKSLPNPVLRSLGRLPTESTAIANLVRSDGEVIPLESNSAAIRADDGTIVGAVWTFRDITEKRAEARRKDDYLSMLAHELRNPLAPVLTGAQLLAQTGASPEQRKVLDVIERQVTHLSRLVDDILELTRFRRGQIQLERSPIDVADAVDAAVDAARPLADARRHELVCHIDPECEEIVVEADRERLHQVLTNLMLNAVKYTDPGGHIDVRFLMREGVPTVAVVDDGRGVTPEDLESIFQPFVQTARSLDRSEGGLGLGLAVVSEIAERHGWTIGASSEGEGCGSEFYVSFPAFDRHEGPALEQRSEPLSAEGDSRKILIIEDNVDAADMLAMLLEDAGYEAQVAYDGLSGLERFEAQVPQIVILDFGLPGLDGFEVARRLRALPGGDDAKLIMVTGYSQNPPGASEEGAEIDHRLTKPIDIEVLRELLRPAA